MDAEQKRCSNRQYRALCGTVERQRKVEKLLEKKGLKDYLDATPSCKVASSQGLEKHITYTLRRLTKVGS